METDTSKMISLNGSNYPLWKARMEDLLYVKGLYQPVFCSNKPLDKTTEEWNVLHRQVCGYIRQWVDDNVLNLVIGEENARSLWTKLEHLYAQNPSNSKLSLIKQLMCLRYRDGTAMLDHLNHFSGIINQLSQVGVTFDDEVQGLWLLGSLPDSWKVSFSNSVVDNDGVVSMKMVKYALLNVSVNEKSLDFTSHSHSNTTIKVVCDKDLHKQIGKDIYFDLVDFDRVRSRFCVHKESPFVLLKDQVAKELGIPVEYQLFWRWAKRHNHTYRPYRSLTPLEEVKSVEKYSRKNNELHLFLEVELGQYSQPVPPPVITKEDILLFFKLYDPIKESLRYVGRLFVKHTGKPTQILAKLNALAGFAPHEEIELFEEIRFDQSDHMCVHVDKDLTFQASQIQDGDIICFQRSLQAGTVECPYPDVLSFLEYIRNRQV